MPFKRLLHHPRLLDALVALVAALGIYIFLGQVDTHYPVKHWLFWRYAAAWGISAFWSLALLTAGHRTLTAVRRRVLPIREQLVMSVAVGVLVFFLAMFVGGALKLYGSVYFVALPVLMIVAGARATSRYLMRIRRHVLAARRRTRSPMRLWARPLVVFGLLSLLAVYLPILLPENVSYDSRWYHMAIGEQYATAGGIFPYREGWFLGAYPHLSSYIYAWAFLRPAGSLFDHVELAAHLEFVLFLWTLAAVPALVRALLPRVRSPQTWVALFLFPGVLIYDSSLNGGADHIAAFWAIPVYLTLLRAWRDLTPVNAGWFAAMVAGALNTKYSAVAIVAGPLVGFGLRVLFSLLPQRGPSPWGRSWRTLAAAGSAIVVVLLVTLPHWGKNWVWYGDPVYPLLHGKLGIHPWSAEAARQFATMQTAAWRAPHTMEGLHESLKVLFTFSFIPHDWTTMHGVVPVLGSLFTLTMLFLPFIWRARIWGIYASTHLCVFVWFWVQHEDRYLQGLVPVMASGTAAVVVHLWRQRGSLARVAVAALVGLQVVWGGDIFFFPAHQMLGGSPLKALVDHLSSGFHGDYTQRVTTYGGYAEIRKHLKPSDVVLLHEDHIQLGIGVHTIQDSAGFQGGLYYTDLVSPAAFARKLAEYRATHVLWRSSSLQSTSISEDLVFYDFVARRTLESTVVSGYNLGRVPAAVSDERPFGDVVAFYGCRNNDDFAYSPGLYHLRDLNIIFLEHRTPSQVPQPFAPAPAHAKPDIDVDRADFVVINLGCHTGMTPRLEKAFVEIGHLKQLSYWVRTSAP